MPKTHYFGYGSNLNAADWSRWCSGKEYAVAPPEKVSNACLSAFRPVFNECLKSRGDGVLDTNSFYPVRLRESVSSRDFQPATIPAENVFKKNRNKPNFDE